MSPRFEGELGAAEQREDHARLPDRTAMRLPSGVPAGAAALARVGQWHQASSPGGSQPARHGGDHSCSASNHVPRHMQIDAYCVRHTANKDAAPISRKTPSGGAPLHGAVVVPNALAGAIM
jgi:hypothetical protein